MIDTDTNQLLDKWNLYIQNQNIEHSQRLKKQIDNIAVGHEDPSFQKRYTLVLSKYNLLMQDFESMKMKLSEVEPFRSASENMLSFYYYYFNGTMKYSSNCFQEAIQLYKRAEKYLPLASDGVQSAELYYKLASAYHRESKAMLSIRYTALALDSFKNGYAYQRTADCENLMGMNKKEIGEYEEAEVHFRNALTYAEMFHHTDRKITLYYNLGSLYADQQLYENAVEYLKLALQMMTDGQKSHKVKTLFLLAEMLYESGDGQGAKYCLNEGMNLCFEEKKQADYFRFRMLEAKYEPDNDRLEQVYSEGIAHFQQQGLWRFVKEYSELLASEFKKKGKYKEASEYYELAITADKKIKGEE